MTTGQTDGQTDRQTPDKVIPMCRYASQATQKWYIHIYIGINGKTILIFIDMEHDWKKATLKPKVVAKNSDATNLTRHFKGGHILWQAV